MKRLSALALIVALFAALMAPAVAGAAPKPGSGGPRHATDGITQSVTGTLADGTGSVAGTVTVTQFANQAGNLAAVGTFDGTITDAAGTVTQGTQQIALPALASGTCEILDLVLGPLDLNLLGLQVHLDQVHLNITAVSGPGNLLGNLLCAVAGLLDGNAPLNAITNLLNQILGLLG